MYTLYNYLSNIKYVLYRYLAFSVRSNLINVGASNTSEVGTYAEDTLNYVYGE